MITRPVDDWTYVVTDVELDGPWPGVNSMRAFASVAVSLDGTEHGRFEAVLEPLPGTAPDERTLAWFEGHPEAWTAAISNPEPVPIVMARYVDWLKALPWPRMFAACPMALDGPWIDYYLRRFLDAQASTSEHGVIFVMTLPDAVAGGRVVAAGRREPLRRSARAAVRRHRGDGTRGGSPFPTVARARPAGLTTTSADAN